MADEEILKDSQVNKNILQKTLSFAKAIAFGDNKVSAARVKKRLEICQECPLMVIDDANRMRCSVCSCKLSSKDNRLYSLLAYEETEHYGCFWPGKKGEPRQSKWKEKGV